MEKLRQQTWWIYAAAALALLPLLLLRDFTPDNELRYMSIADEALRDGSVWCFANHGEVYADKPPLYLWIVMAGRLLLGNGCMWFVGLFSLGAMLLVGRVMDGWARRALSPSQRQAALLMLFTCGYFPGLAVVLRMDMLMTLFIVLALREVWRMDCGVPTRRHELLLGVYTFLALFTKGPYGVLIPLLSSAVWLLWVGRFRSFRRIWGWPAWAAIIGGCAVWFGCAWAEGGDAYLNNLLFHQTVDRASNAFTHARPWWYYLVHMWYVMAPWSVLIAGAAVVRRRTLASGPYRRMMIAVFAATLLILSCVSSKLQVYMLPAIPFAVYFGASLIHGRGLLRAVKVIALVLLALIFGASFFLPALNPKIGYGAVCSEVAALNPSAVYVDSSVRRGENIDAYFSVPVEVIGASDSTFVLPRGAALLLPGTEGRKLTYKFNR